MARVLRSPWLWVLAAVVVLAAGALVGVMMALSGPDIDDGSWLVVDLRGGVPEYPPPADLLAQAMGGGPGESLQRILSNLEKVPADDRIEGVILKLGMGFSAGTATRDEIRAAVARVREAGKPVHAWAEWMERPAYQVAAACDTISLVPTGTVVLTGSAVIRDYYRGTLDKLGIRPNIHKIKDYKSAAEMVTRKDMSPEARANQEWLMDDLWSQMVAGLQHDRGLDETRIVELMEHALFTADEAKGAGLVDEVRYWDEVEDALKGEGDEELSTVSAATYAKVRPDDLGLGGDSEIAVVHARGIIGGRKSRVSPVLGVMMGHESVAADLRQARRDEDVRAVVFRVDSRGGESLASDLIAHEVDLVAQTKPIVVSMVDVAASGGYMIAYRGSRVVALPSTITGSIGSISGKFNVAGLYDKLGVSFDKVTKGPMALLFDPTRDFTEAERARFEADHWASFNQWLSDVADRRGMTFEDAEKLAHGRVWTGRQAVENGLVDELGGLDRAVEVAKELAGIPAEEGVQLVHYPKSRTLLESLLDHDGGGLSSAIQYVLYRTMSEELTDAQRLATGPSLLMDPIEIR